MAQPTRMESLADPAQAVEPAWVWGEAELPQGFPPPGPVGEIVFKRYPAYRAAIKRAPQDASPQQNEMFWPLFQHIKKHAIAMTAPVEMTYGTQADQQPSIRMTAMAFMYAQPDVGTVGHDGPVEVVDLPARKVLSIGVRGRYSEARFQTALQQLQDHLAIHAERYQVAGPPRYLGYNSPFVPWFLRYGEVQLPVNLVQP